MRVPFLDLQSINSRQRDALLAAVAGVIDAGRYIGGAAVTTFEGEFAERVTAEHCVGVGNGLDALTLCLRALGVGPGDDVLVPTHTFIATWLAVSATGARPVGVEPDPDTMLIDAERVHAALTPRTRGVIPVDLYGLPCDIRALMNLAKGEGWFVLEDAAQAHGARVHDVPVGKLADATAWSFYPGKNLGALGDAGCLTTDRRDLADQVRLLANYGSRRKYEHEETGVNSRLDAVQAAMLSVKLRLLDGDNLRRREIAERYLDGLSATPLRTLTVPPGHVPVWHLFPVRVDDRDGLAEHLSSRGVETLIHYPKAPHESRAYAGLDQHFPVAEGLARSLLSLPIGPHLADEQVDWVLASVHEWLRGR